ncbi:putative disintegrin and metalloproteinase domain-containing protein 19, partial [Triplophysa rosa]
YTKHRQKNGQISSTRHLVVMLSVFLCNGLLEIVGGKSWEEVEDKGQRVTAHWISHNTIQQEYGTTFKLLAHDFSETHYENGLPITQTNNHTDHCFYHGKVRGHTDSWVALSTCLGMRGLIVLNSNDTFYLEPIGGQEVLHHTFYRTEHLPIKSGTCGHGHQTGHLSLFSGHLKPLHQRVRRNVWGTTKYMELYIVADNTLFRKQNKDLQKTKQRIMEIANYVDK